MAIGRHIAGLSKGCYRVSWCGFGTEAGAACSASSGDSVIIPGNYSTITIQVLGTFAGATITMEGSNDGGTTWASIDRSPAGTAMTFTAAGMDRANDVPQMIRPTLTAGCASDLDVLAIIRAS